MSPQASHITGIQAPAVSLDVLLNRFLAIHMQVQTLTTLSFNVSTLPHTKCYYIYKHHIITAALQQRCAYV